MRSAATARQLIVSLAFVSAVGWATQAHAQFAAGSTWVRTDAHGKGITMSVDACCNGGLRLTYKVPPMGGQPGATLTVDSPMDGTDVPTLVGGKPSGQTMAVKRVDDHHYSAVVKVGGKPLGTSHGTVSPDGKTLTVESVMDVGGKSDKVIETWVRK
jgi:hypothetical protein